MYTWRTCIVNACMQMGLKYGCAVEDVITGLAMQCRGWKSIYFDTPERTGFLGVAPTTLLQVLVQQKRWCEGNFHILLRYCPFLYGYKTISLGLQISYCVDLLWAPHCLASLYCVTIPSLCLLRGISLFPKVTKVFNYHNKNHCCSYKLFKPQKLNRLGLQKSTIENT